MSFALKVISGKYKDAQFPLVEKREIVVGRSSEVEMVLVEEMVSRRHARIELREEGIFVEDLGSTNGTFVNGERITKTKLKVADRILIGSNIFKVVRLGGDSEDDEVVEEDVEEPPPTVVPRLSHRRATDRSGESRMSGNLAEIPLPDLLQLFGSSRKSGVLLVECNNQLGHIFLDNGLVLHVEIEDAERKLLDMPATKAMFRMLHWEQGLFELEPPNERREFESPMNSSVQELLMEGFRQKDELVKLSSKLPPRDAALRVNDLGDKVKELDSVALDTWQLAQATNQVGTTIDESHYTDFETSQALVQLLDSGFLAVVENAD